MSVHIQKTSNRKHRTSCFLGCFGFSVQDDVEKKISTDGGSGVGGGGKEKYGGQRISRYWFRRMKKSSAKTVPMNNSKFAPKLRSSKEIHVLKKDKNLYATSDQLPAAAAAGNNLNEFVSAEPDQVGLYKSSEVTTYNNSEHFILENVNSLGGENGTIRYDVSRPTRKQLPKSVSEQGIYGCRSNENDAKFGSLVGISIIMVILGIMLIWGKLCAILCTAICFYSITSFRTQLRNESNSKKDFDESNSKEYKKKIVLQGFLERSNQRK